MGETMQGWQLSDAGPRAYERYLASGFFAGWAEEMTSAAGVRPGDRVLDVACGTGIVARTAAARLDGSGSVDAIDLNPAMLEVAREVTVDVRPAITFRQADAGDLPYDAGWFDVAICQQALQFFPDPALALKELHRVLAHEGRLGFMVCASIAHNPAYGVFAEALARHVSEEAGGMMRSPFIERGSEDLRMWTRGAGFDDVHVRLDVRPVRYPSLKDFVRREVASSPLAAAMADIGTEVWDAVAAQVSDGLAGSIDDDGVVFPIQSWTVTAAA